MEKQTNKQTNPALPASQPLPDVFQSSEEETRGSRKGHPPSTPAPGTQIPAEKEQSQGQWKGPFPQESWLGWWEVRAGKAQGQMEPRQEEEEEVWRWESFSWEWVSRDKQGHGQQAFLAGQELQNPLQVRISLFLGSGGLLPISQDAGPCQPGSCLRPTPH